MGLDLYHLKPCAAPADRSAGISFSLEELAEINTPAAFLEKHKPLLVQVSVPPDIFSICILASEQQQRVFEQQFGKHDNWRLLTGTMESLAPVICEIETEKELGAARQAIIDVILFYRRSVACLPIYKTMERFGRGDFPQF